MIGVRARGGAPFVDDKLPEPQPAAGDALVRVRLAGICGTDRAVLAGYGGHGGVLGHEFTGEVIEAPDDAGWEGKRVVAGITIACGRCAPCRRLRPGHCENRRVLGIRGADGVFAERVCIPASNLVAVPDSVSDDAAVFAEPLAAALRICEQVAVDRAERVAVVGAGILGQLAARVLAQRRCRLSVVARHPVQRQRLDAADIAWIAEGKGKTGAYDCVVEASGSAEGLCEAMRLVRPEGTVVLKSSLDPGTPVDLSALVVNEITLVGSRCGPMTEAVARLAGSTIATADLIESRFALTEAPAAFARAASPGALKVLLRI